MLRYTCSSSAISELLWFQPFTCALYVARNRDALGFRGVRYCNLATFNLIVAIWAAVQSAWSSTMPAASHLHPHQCHMPSWQRIRPAIRLAKSRGSMQHALHPRKGRSCGTQAPHACMPSCASASAHAQCLRMHEQATPHAGQQRAAGAPRAPRGWARR